MNRSRQPIEIAAVASVVATAGLALALAFAGCGAAGMGDAPQPDAGAGQAGTSAGGGPAGAGGPPAVDAAPPGEDRAPPRVDAALPADASAPDRASAVDAPRAEAAAPMEAGAEAGAETRPPAIAEPACQWPTPAGDQKVGATIGVSKLFDGGMKRFIGDGPLGSSGQVEGQPPLFQLANGSTLRNVILGNPAADGVHCAGTCTLENVWWEDVGEDAATSSGSSATQVMTIQGGGARHATDKVFQHNGAGTMVIQDFCAEDFGKLYRSCGNCKSQYGRHVVLRNVAVRTPAGALAGVNENYGDTATFSGIFVPGGVTICQRYTGNNTGAEPVQTGSGADGKFCLYAKTDIVSR